MVALISPARQKNVHPASWTFRPNPYPSRFLTNLQPVAQGSLSNCNASGKNVPSLIRMVLVLIVSAIWPLLGVSSLPFRLPYLISLTLLTHAPPPPPPPQ